LTGLGIGGEYVAINSAIQELIPARYRGRVDLAVNGSFWVGAGLAGIISVMITDPQIASAGIGWRLAFLVGAVLALFVLFMRRSMPESPRWLMTHHRAEEADAVVATIENG